MESFYIDESGYTGFDLLNTEQCFQGAAAISISDDEALHLIRTHFPNLQMVELKYRALARRPNNHLRLINLQRDILSNYKCVTYVCDKRYLLVLMFLDYAVEPFYFRRGIDFYEDGQNYALGSLLYKVGPTLFGKKGFETLLAAFQHAIKAKTPEAIGDLVFAARQLNWRKLPEALGPLVQASPECLSAIATQGVTTDAAFVVLQSLINRMEVMASGAYQVVHDQTKNLLQYHELLDRYINHQENVEFQTSAMASIKFPLKLSSVRQVDSKACPAVQLADVMIGSAIEAANALTGKRKPELDPNEVMELYAEGQFIHLIPSLDFEAHKQFRRGSQAAQVIDYFGTNFHG